MAHRLVGEEAPGRRRFVHADNRSRRTAARRRCGSSCWDRSASLDRCRVWVAAACAGRRLPPLLLFQRPAGASLQLLDLGFESVRIARRAAGSPRCSHRRPRSRSPACSMSRLRAVELAQLAGDGRVEARVTVQARRLLPGHGVGRAARRRANTARRAPQAARRHQYPRKRPTSSKTQRPHATRTGPEHLQEKCEIPGKRRETKVATALWARPREPLARLQGPGRYPIFPLGILGLDRLAR